MSQDCLPRGPFKSSWLWSACVRMVLSFFQDFFQVPGASAATADPVRPSAQRLRFCAVSLGCCNRVLHLGGRKHQKHVVSSSAGLEFHIKVLSGGAALCPEAPGEGPSLHLPAPDVSLHAWACGCILQPLPQLHEALPTLCVCIFALFVFFLLFLLCLR